MAARGRPDRSNTNRDNPMKTYYQRDGNEYGFYRQRPGREPEKTWGGPEVAVCFDKRTGTVFKYGDPAAVWERARTARSSWAGIGQDPADIVVLSSDSWDIDELNKIRDCSGYILRYVEKNNIEL